MAGSGTITVDGVVYPTHAGQVYLVEGAKPHAVGALTDHVLLAVGSPHKAPDAPDRMALVEYAALATVFPALTCLICNKRAVLPAALHNVDCPHCPCAACAATGGPV